MRISVFRGDCCFKEWVDAIAAEGIGYLVLSPADLRSVPGTSSSAVVFCDPRDFRLKNSITQVLLNCRDLGIPTYPDLRSHLLYNDKVVQSSEFARLGIPSPVTRVFWDRNDAMEWAESASYPVVTKTSCGAGSGGVSLVENPGRARKIIAKAFGGGRRVDTYPPETSLRLMRGALRWMLSESPLAALQVCARLAGKHSTLRGSPFRERDFVLFQDYLDGNDFDYRITVIGNRAFGMRRYNRRSDFRASGSNLQNLDPAGIPPEVIQTAFMTADLLGMNLSMAADILMDRGVPKVIEVSHMFANAHKEYPGFWTDDGKWHGEPCTRFDSVTGNFIRQILARTRINGDG